MFIRCGDGIISLNQACETYGVALDEQTLELDEVETVRLRWKTS